MNAWIGTLLKDKMGENPFSPLDIHFADLVAEKLAQREKEPLWLAAALLSRARSQGHICLELDQAGADLEPEAAKRLGIPPAADWRAALKKSGVVGAPDEYRPLILDPNQRLYLYRYWEYQQRTADFILDHLNDAAVDEKRLEAGLDRLFGESQSNGQGIDWQRVAAETALKKRFCVISGGPGTGKTTTVAKILVLLVEQSLSAFPVPGGSGERLPRIHEGSGDRLPRIHLAAPTGKAAARLQAAIVAQKQQLKDQVSEKTRKRIPETAATLHRLLGPIPNSPYFRHHRKNRLNADAVVVDEASMVDLALMAKLVDALPRRARLILLGDKDQLASVEAGAVLGDICDSENRQAHAGIRSPESGIAACVVQLRKSYRFQPKGGIARVSRAVNAGEGKTALKILQSEESPEIRWQPLPDPHHLAAGLRAELIRGYQAYLRALDDPQRLFSLLDRFRILCALRQGPYGVARINAHAEAILKAEGLIAPQGEWYAGRPVLITENAYSLQLFNGDVGIALPDPKISHPDPLGTQTLRVCFPGPGGTVRYIHPLRLPAHETVYAMTVHKSQGSEFDRVLLILPEGDARVLTRELIYTGITRAVHHTRIWGDETVFCRAVARRIQRSSGLRDALWESD